MKKNTVGARCALPILLGIPALALVFGILVSSCGTMDGKGGEQRASIQAHKTGVDFEIVDGNGKHILSAQTPFTAKLKTSRALVLPAQYFIKYKTETGEEKTQKIPLEFNASVPIKDSLWFFLAVLPGVVAWVVDGANGALYGIPQDVLLEEAAYNPDQEGMFMLVSIDDIRPEARQYLVPLNAGQ